MRHHDQATRAPHARGRELEVRPTERLDSDAGRKTRRDEVCVDERTDDRDRDGSELQGSQLEVGAAMAGLTPIETPQTEREEREHGASECGSGC